MTGLLLPNLFEIQEQEAGLQAAFQSFKSEHAALLESATTDDERDSLVKDLFETWGERLLIRLTSNLAIRASFAQRTEEIFPDIDPTLVAYKHWVDRDGNHHDRSRIRLSLEDAMEIVKTVIEAETSQLKASTTPARATDRPKPEGFGKPVTKKSGQSAQIAALERQIADLRAADSETLATV